MSNNKIVMPSGINLNQLSQLAKSNPRYTRMFTGLAQIDKVIKALVKDSIVAIGNDEIYYIKTELMNQCYNLYLFNAERQATVGVSWPLADFLNKCENKTINYDVSDKLSKMIARFGEKGISTGEKINWVY